MIHGLEISMEEAFNFTECGLPIVQTSWNALGRNPGLGLIDTDTAQPNPVPCDFKWPGSGWTTGVPKGPRIRFSQFFDWVPVPPVTWKQMVLHGARVDTASAFTATRMEEVDELLPCDPPDTGGDARRSSRPGARVTRDDPSVVSYHLSLKDSSFHNRQARRLNNTIGRRSMHKCDSMCAAIKHNSFA